jgi:hypothetical protein
VELVRQAIVEGLRLHPRVAQQGLGTDRDIRERLVAGLPTIVPFRGRPLHRVVALLDWDHRLPSRQLTLRVHALYDSKGLDRLEAAFNDRAAEIKRKDLYPEFDVPDLSDLPGDESYDAELTPDMTVETMRLVSPWRREVDPGAAGAAVRSVRSSPVFAKAKASLPGRSPNLGDLEAVAWMPPCESGQPRWTIDVWWLTAFDGRIGKGWSFLVDPEAEAAEKILAHREFTVRTA